MLDGCIASGNALLSRCDAMRIRLHSNALCLPSACLNVSKRLESQSAGSAWTNAHHFFNCTCLANQTNCNDMHGRLPCMVNGMVNSACFSVGGLAALQRLNMHKTQAPLHTTADRVSRNSHRLRFSKAEASSTALLDGITRRITVGHSWPRPSLVTSPEQRPIWRQQRANSFCWAMLVHVSI